MVYCHTLLYGFFRPSKKTHADFALFWVKKHKINWRFHVLFSISVESIHFCKFLYQRTRNSCTFA
jgi:hypothetical protein